MKTRLLRPCFHYHTEVIDGNDYPWYLHASFLQGTSIMETALESPEITLIPLKQLFQEAAEAEKLTILNMRYDTYRGPFAETAERYLLGDKGFIEHLRQVGFTFGPDPKRPTNGMVYLMGHSHQEGCAIFESDCWAWRKTEKNPYLTVGFRLVLSERERGILAIPIIWGNMDGSAVHQRTIHRLAMAITAQFPDRVHRLLEEVREDESPIIPWVCIGRSGLRSVNMLFQEAYQYNDQIDRLARSTVSPFFPDPMGTKEKYFVPEEQHSALFRQWRKQLKSFRDRLR